MQSSTAPRTCKKPPRTDWSGQYFVLFIGDCRSLVIDVGPREGRPTEVLRVAGRVSDGSRLYIRVRALSRWNKLLYTCIHVNERIVDGAVTNRPDCTSFDTLPCLKV